MNQNSFVCKYSTYTNHGLRSLHDLYKVQYLKDQQNQEYDAYHKQKQGLTEQILVEQIWKTEKLFPLIPFIDFQFGELSYLLTPKDQNTFTLRQFIRNNRELQFIVSSIIKETLCAMAVLHEQNIFGFRLSLDTVFIKKYNQDIKVFLFKVFNFQFYQEGVPQFFDIKNNEQSTQNDIKQVGQMGNYLMSLAKITNLNLSMYLQEMQNTQQPISYYIQKLGISEQFQQLKQNQINFLEQCQHYQYIKSQQLIEIDHKMKNLKFQQAVEAKQLKVLVQELQNMQELLSQDLKNSIYNRIIKDFTQQIKNFDQQYKEIEILLAQNISIEAEIQNVLNLNKIQIENHILILKQMLEIYNIDQIPPKKLEEMLFRFENHFQTFFDDFDFSQNYQYYLEEIRNRIIKFDAVTLSFNCMNETIEQYKNFYVDEPLQEFRNLSNEYIEQLNQFDVRNKEFYNEYRQEECDVEKQKLIQKLQQNQIQDFQQGNCIRIFTKEFFEKMINQIKTKHDEILMKKNELEQIFKQQKKNLEQIGIYQPKNIETFRQNIVILSRNFKDEQKIKQIAWVKDQQQPGYEQAIINLLKELMLV